MNKLQNSLGNKRIIRNRNLIKELYEIEISQKAEAIYKVCSSKIQNKLLTTNKVQTIANRCGISEIVSRVLQCNTTIVAYVCLRLLYRRQKSHKFAEKCYFILSINSSPFNQVN